LAFLGALDNCNADLMASKALGALDNCNADLMASKALGALAVAQRDISGAQFCAPEIEPR